MTAVVSEMDSEIDRETSKDGLDWSPLDNLEALKKVSGESCTSIVQEQGTGGLAEWHSMVSTAIFNGSCWFREPVRALYFWGIYVIYPNRIHFLSQAWEIVSLSLNAF